MSWETFQFGQIFLDDEPQLVPDFPTTDIPEYFGPKSIDIKDAQDEEPITWINPVGTNLLVADRVLLTMVSWDDLDEQGFVKGKEVHIGGKSYRCRLLQVGDTEGVPNEWDAILGTTTDDNGIWHWKNIWFWGMDAVKDMPSDRVIRECDNWSDAPAAGRYIDVGFRPVLEPITSSVTSSTPISAPTSASPTTVPTSSGSAESTERAMLDGQEFVLQYLQQDSWDRTLTLRLSSVAGNAFNNMPNGTTVKMYTILADGNPIRMDLQKPVPVFSEVALQITDKYFGDEFLVSWVILDNMAIANRLLYKT